MERGEKYFLGIDFYDCVYVIPENKKEYWSILQKRFFNDPDKYRQEEHYQDIIDEFGKYEIKCNVSDINFENLSTCIQ